MYIGLHVNCLLFLSDFNKSVIFLAVLLKNAHILHFMKIPPVEAELFHAGGRTDMTKLIAAFRNSANAPKKMVKYKHMYLS